MPSLLDADRQLQFDYAIRFPNGAYYTGRAGRAYQGAKSEAFTYTYAGAERKIAAMRWEGATVERVL